MVSLRTDTTGLLLRNNLGNATSSLNSTMQKLQTGYKINFVKDDAAGFYSVSLLNKKISSMLVVQQNTSEGISFLKTAEGGLEAMRNILTRIRNLSFQAANEIYTEESIFAIQSEAGQLYDELSRIRETMTYNGLNVYYDSREPAMANTISTFSLGVGLSPGFVDDSGGISQAGVPVNSPSPGVDIGVEAMLAAVSFSAGNTSVTDTISFSSDQTQIVNINGVEYTITNELSNDNDISYGRDETTGVITFVGNNFTIKGQSDVVHDIIIQGRDNTIYGGNLDDKFSIAEGSTGITIDGGPGTNTVTGDIVNNSTINVVDANTRLLELTEGTVMPLAINIDGTTYNYSVSTSDTAAELRYKCDSSGEITFIGSSGNIIIRSDENQSQNVNLGKNITYYGSNNGDKIHTDGATVYCGSGVNDITCSNVGSVIHCGDGTNSIGCNSNNSVIYCEDGTNTISCTANNVGIYGGTGSTDLELSGSYCSVISNGNMAINLTGSQNAISGTGSNNSLIDSGTNNFIHGFADADNAELISTGIFDINGIQYDISGSTDRPLLYKTDIITGETSFCGNGYTIRGMSDTEYNISLYGSKMIFYGSENDDIISVYGSDCSAYGQGGNDNIIFANNGTTINTANNPNNYSNSVSNSVTDPPTRGNGINVSEQLRTLNTINSLGLDEDDSGGSIPVPIGAARAQGVAPTPMAYSMSRDASTLDPYDLSLNVDITSGKASAFSIDMAFDLDSLTLDFSTRESSLETMDKVDKLIAQVIDKLTLIGSGLNRLDSVQASQLVKMDNYISSLSTLKDADISKLSSNYIRSQILQEATVNLLSLTRNYNAQNVLGLITSATAGH